MVRLLREGYGSGGLKSVLGGKDAIELLTTVTVVEVTWAELPPIGHV